MPNTIKSVCDEIKDKLAKMPAQDFGAASVVHIMQRVVDPKGTKKLSPKEVKVTRAFLEILIKTAYQ